MFSIKEKNYYASLLQSRFDYACNVWYRGLEKRLKTKLQTAQNKIIRYILGYSTRHHLVKEDFSKLKYLDVSSRVDYLTLNMMYNIFNRSAPIYMCNFQMVQNVHSHNTRYSDMAFDHLLSLM